MIDTTKAVTGVSYNGSSMKLIGNYDPSDAMTRRVINWDGELLSETEINVGDTVYLPTTPPEITDPLLEFEKYICTSEVGSSVVCDYDIGVACRVKEQINVDGTLVRPTILKYVVTSSLLSPTLGWYSPNKTGTIYIDWGDGTIDTITATSKSGTQSHTYAQEGLYIIKMYSTSMYGVDGGYEIGCFKTQDYCNLLVSAYLGDNFYMDINAFYNCSSMKTVVFPSGNLYTKATSAFNGCKSLKCIIKENVGQSEKQFSYSGIKYCVTQDIFYSGNVANYLFDNCFNLSKIILSSLNLQNSMQLGNAMFSNCRALKKVIIQPSITSITATCFANCSSLTTLKMLNTTNLTSINDQAFNNCYSLNSIDIPNTVTSIGNSVFYNCSALKEITIPSSVTTTGTDLFYNCYSLKKINMQGGTNISCNSCNALSEITLPTGLTTISSSGFSNCFSLNSLVIPDSVTSIPANSLNASYLRELTIPNGWNNALSCYSWQLSVNSLVSIANRIADRTATTSLTLTLKSSLRPIMLMTKVDSTGAIDDTSSTTLLDFITNKNWTVTFS